MSFFERNNWKFEKIESLLKKMKERKQEDILEELEQFVGCGEGLTPSGDDILIGFVSFLFKVEQTRNKKFEEELEKMVERIIQEKRTTLISESYLLSCVRGNFSRPLHCLFHLLLNEEDAIRESKQTESRESDEIRVNRWKSWKVEQVVQLFLEHGASSGVDTLLGIILSIQFTFRIIK